VGGRHRAGWVGGSDKGEGAGGGGGANPPGAEGAGGRVVEEGIVTRLHAVGFIAGATPLLTGTLAGHPSNRTMHSG
jgi:hypothetical protein